jgi:hypothetical protein
MAQVVQADGGQAGVGGEALDALRNPVGIERRAILAGKRQPVILSRRPPGEPLGDLAFSVLAQHGRSVRRSGKIK